MLARFLRSFSSVFRLPGDRERRVVHVHREPLLELRHAVVEPFCIKGASSMMCCPDFDVRSRRSIIASCFASIVLTVCCVSLYSCPAAIAGHRRLQPLHLRAELPVLLHHPPWSAAPPPQG